MGGPVIRKKFNIPIPDDLKDIHSRIKYAGRELFLVGGAVRDALMGKTPKDYDVATNASPEEVIKILQRDNTLRLDLTGKQFGVVRVKTKADGEYEIATFREDIGKGKNTSVKFSTIENDVRRRDLTINALFFDMDSNEIVDYVGGIKDIEDGVIRAVGDPAKRFDEDRIRILRAIRFAGRMGSELDPETKQAIIEDNELVDTETGIAIPADRTTEEFIKGIRSAADVNVFLSMIQELGLFDQLLPGLNVDLQPASTQNHVAQLAAILSSNPEREVAKVLKRMRYSNEDIKAIGFLISISSISRDSAVELKKSFNRQNINVDHLHNFANVMNIPESKVIGFLEFAAAPQAGNPRDFIAQGLKGPEIGKAMAAAELDSYDNFFTEIRQYVRSVLKESLKKTNLTSDTQIFCDMDGVLVRFGERVIKLVNDSLDDPYHLSENPSKGHLKRFRKVQTTLGSDWRATSRSDLEIRAVRNFMMAIISSNPGPVFESMNPWSDALSELWPFLNSTPFQVNILSAPIQHRSSAEQTAAEGKTNWIKAHLSPSPSEIIITPAILKPEYATSNGVANILIDDKTSTVESWINAGGIGILHIPGNSLKTIMELKDLGL